jgi:Protein of unknown function (DUF2587)
MAQENDVSETGDPPRIIVVERRVVPGVAQLLRRHRAGGPEPASGTEEGDKAVNEASEAATTESVSEPAKVMRIGMMVRELLEEVRHANLDEAGRARLRQIHEQSISELASSLSPDLAQELGRMARPFEVASPSEAELRVAQAQLVGWLEGLFHGIQAAFFAQQVDAQLQLEQMRQRRLPPGQGPRARPEDEPPTGSYL